MDAREQQWQRGHHAPVLGFTCARTHLLMRDDGRRSASTHNIEAVTIKTESLGVGWLVSHARLGRERACVHSGQRASLVIEF